jgi:hypothetical protein
MLRKLVVNCDAVTPPVTNIEPLAKIIGRITKLEYLDLNFRQWCNTPHLQDISELGRQLLNQPNLSYLHINL